MGRTMREPMARGGLVLVALLAGPIRPASAQEAERVPTIPAGTPAVFFPVQAVRPTPGGAWPGGAASEREALERMDAELSFAFDEEPGAASWSLPDDLVRRLRRNPTVKVDPYRLAFHGLIKKPDPRDQLYEPLHSQLRQVAALFNSRILVVPLLLWYERDEPDLEPEEAETTEADTAEPETERGRAVLLTAIIDIRKSKVLWHGEIRGGLSEPTSSRLLTTLAFVAAHDLSP